MHEYRAAIEAWIARAAKFPLTISVHQPQNVSDSTKGKAEQNSILETVFQVSKQWRSIQIAAPASTLERVLAMSGHDLESLEHFAAQWSISYRAQSALTTAGAGAGGGTAGEGSGPSSPAITLFSSAPNLKRLSLQNIPHTIPQLHVQWHNITELILGEFAIPRGAPRHLLFAHRALDVLEKCPNLARCRLTLGNPHAFSLSPTGGGHQQLTQIDESRAVVRLEYLECLCILEGDPLGSFFKFLELPKLKEFVFKTAQYPRPSLEPGLAQGSNNTNTMTAASCLLPLLERYGENIEKLRMDESIMSVEDLEKCFGLLKNLTHLKLTRRSCIRRVWHSRTFRRGGQTNLNLIGSLTRSIWEKMTPKVPVTPGSIDPVQDLGSEGGMEQVVSCHRDSDLLLPKLTSFSCRVHAPELVQDHVIQFLRARRHPSCANTLLKNFAIMFYSTEPEQRYKNISGELAKRGVNTDGMALDVRYRRTYGDSLVGPNDFIVAPSLRPAWPTTENRRGMFFGVGDFYDEDE
ncbi:hypothetical protein MD484_g754, partial [Candolleomyces efflorescens]